ncbi:MAG: response regulator [Candidatus Heimdallarchaeota archaeon]|nr:response regulator [Candidatus Heimdallarchaeota archaeon]
MAQILIADDNKELRALFCLMLKDFDLLEAENGIEAIEVCKKNEIELILMDILMPEMDGIVATREILNSYPEIIILGITAYTNRADELIKAGAKEVLIKPIRRKELVEKVNEYIK